MVIRISKSKPGYHAKVGREITTVADALSISTALKTTRGQFTVYRGQSDKGILRPPIFRNARQYRHERDMVRDLVSIHPQEFSGDPLMLDRLARMQHYGLPTRLLDVTQNFLVALYFASDPLGADEGEVFVITGNNDLKKYYDSDAVSMVANLSNLSETEKKELWELSPDNDAVVENDSFNKYPHMDRLLQFVRNEKPYFRSKAKKQDLKSTFFVIPKKNNRRIVAQSGAFLIFGLVGIDRTPDLSMYNITRHPVPQDKKVSIRSELEALGINEVNLFPEIEHAAKYILDSYKVS